MIYRMKSILTTVMSVVLAASIFPMAACAQPAPVPEPKPLESEAIAYALSLGVGWNLGNSFDAHVEGISGETLWGNPKVTPELFKRLKAAGFSSVRIPVTWMGHIGKAPEYRIEKAWMDRIAEVVSWAHNNDLKVIINIHHDGFGAEKDLSRQAYHWLDLPAAAKDEQKNTEIMQKLAMVWMQIANRFQNDGDWLMFEVLNEIQDGNWGGGENLTDGGAMYRTLNDWNQLCVDIIRSTGGNNATRYIGIPSFVCQPDKAVKYLRLPEDSAANRLLVSVHIYDPWDYAGSAKYSEWGHSGKDIVPDSKGEEDYNATLDALYNKFVRRGVPVYVGEYGCVHRNTKKAEEFRKYYLEYTVKSLRNHKMPVFVWDNANPGTGEEAFGLIRHDNGKFINNAEEIVRIIIDSWNNNDPAYTLPSIYNRAPEAK